MIKQINSIKANTNKIIIGNHDFLLKLKDLTSAEKKYLKDNFEEKNSPFELNKLSHRIYFVVADSKKSHAESLENMRSMGYKCLQSLKKNKIENISVDANTVEENLLIAFLEGLLLSSYTFDKYLSKKENKYKLKSLDIVFGRKINQKLKELHVVVQSVFLARDLINEPLSYLTAAQLAEEAKKAGEESGFKVEVLNKRKIESLRMGGILSINRGSIEPPTFSILEWKPANAVNKKPVVLVGKGIVFDTGGLSLKQTADSMEYMKSDMSGAAAVIGTFYAMAKNKLPVYCIGLIPATENRPDGNAITPGDIVKMYDGTTVEVLNTDAEGRMILADALSYAKKYKPELVFDIATLTGAASAAIGQYGIVTMGNATRKYFSMLEKSGFNVHERIAEFPFWDDYKELIKSDVADLKNIGGRYAGAITAGKFLEHFTDYPWIHLDIAGCAFIKSTDSYRGKWATGVGVRLFYEFLNNFISAKG